MNIKMFLISLVSAFVLISLPAILGIGYVIDWAPEATVFQKLKGYLVDGLLNNFFKKIVLASVIGIVVSFVISKRQHPK